MGEFTRGPWWYDDYGYIFSGVKPEVKMMVAEVRGHGTLQYQENGEKEQTANAALIAAAPELYEACKKALYVLNDPEIEIPLYVSNVMLALAEAIDKANGKEVTK